MISLVSLMWTSAVCFAIAGALRGWRREARGMTGIVLGFFALLQFDSLPRGSLFSLLTNELTFLLQMLIYSGLVVLAYRSKWATHLDNRMRSRRGALLGAAAGFFNGYFLAGSTWYFLDINRYPFAYLVSAPADASASFQSLGLMPVVLLGGGLSGNGALLPIVALLVLAVVILNQ